MREWPYSSFYTILVNGLRYVWSYLELHTRLITTQIGSSAAVPVHSAVSIEHRLCSRHEQILRRSRSGVRYLVAYEEVQTGESAYVYSFCGPQQQLWLARQPPGAFSVLREQIWDDGLMMRMSPGCDISCHCC